MRNSSMLTFHSSFNSKAKREPQNSVCVRFKRRSVVAVCEHVEQGYSCLNKDRSHSIFHKKAAKNAKTEWHFAKISPRGVWVYQT